MLQSIIKLIISSGIIVIVSEIAKKNTLFGGLIASIPLISVLSMIWLYIDTKDIAKVKDLSTSILWMVIPSLTLFIMLPVLINYGVNFYLSLTISILITAIFYGLTIIVLTRYGIQL